MNARSNISRPGQRTALSGSQGQGFRGGSSQSGYLIPPNRLELERARESLLLLKDKMTRRSMIDEFPQRRSERITSAPFEDENNLRNKNYRRVQTYTDSFGDEYEERGQRIGPTQGDRGKSNNMISEKSTLDSMNFKRGNAQGGQYRDDAYDQGGSDYQPKRNPVGRGQAQKPNVTDDYDDYNHGKGGRNANRYEDEYEPPKKSYNVDTLPAKSNGNRNFADEDDIPAENDNEPLVECGEGCGRRFKESVLPKHEKVCQKVFQTKRKKFDMAAKRLTDEDGNLMVDPRKVQKQLKEKPKKKDDGKIAKWKLQSAMLRTQLKAVKGVDVSNTEEAKIVANFEKQDFVNCPHCGRNFNETAGNRHIPVCADRAKAGKVSKPNNAPGPKTHLAKPLTSTMKEPISKKEPVLAKTMTTGLKTTVVKKK